jgi:hypothetical protein
MANLTDEQRRVLELLASIVNGYAEAVLMAHGQARGAGQARARRARRGRAQTTAADRRRMKVMWMPITEIGHKEIAE